VSRNNARGGSLVVSPPADRHAAATPANGCAAPPKQHAPCPVVALSSFVPPAAHSIQRGTGVQLMYDDILARSPASCALASLQCLRLSRYHDGTPMVCLYNCTHTVHMMEGRVEFKIVLNCTFTFQYPSYRKKMKE